MESFVSPLSFIFGEGHEMSNIFIQSAPTDNFIPWEGGDQPVPDLVHVQVKFRNSDYDTNEPLYSQELDWIHVPDELDREFDIVAYRLFPTQPVFTSWNGGANPVGDDVVEVIYRGNPTTVLTTEAIFLDWSHDANDSDVDIVWYRIIH